MRCIGCRVTCEGCWETINYEGKYVTCGCGNAAVRPGLVICNSTSAIQVHDLRWE